MEAIQNLNLMLVNLENWLWYDVIVYCGWIILIVGLAILLFLASNWAGNKRQKYLDQIKRDGPKVPPSSPSL